MEYTVHAGTFLSTEGDYWRYFEIKRLDKDIAEKRQTEQVFIQKHKKY